MKVKKEIPVLAKDIVVGDVVKSSGKVEFLLTDKYGNVQFAYVERDEYLLVDEFGPDDQVDIIREVETPDSVTVTSLFGVELTFSDGPELMFGEVKVNIGIDGVRAMVFPANELIDAIKAVKGTD